MTRLHFAYWSFGFSDSACFHCSQLRADHSGSYVSSAVDTKQKGSSCSQKLIIPEWVFLLFFLWECVDRCTIDASSFEGQLLFLVSLHSIYRNGALFAFSLQSKPIMQQSEDQNPKVLLRVAAAPQPVSSCCQQAVHHHNSSGHRWHLERPHKRNWILLSCKSIGDNGLDNVCTEVKVVVICKVVWRTHSLFLVTWNWELLSKQWSGTLQEKLENTNNLNSSNKEECRVMNLEA